MTNLDNWPIFLVFFSIVTLTFFAIEVGFIIGSRKKKGNKSENFPMENSASGIVLGLLAFILAFSFGVVANRYMEMRDIALEDTDAIGDLYMMADFLPDESANEVRSLLYEYHRIRLEAIASQDQANLKIAIERSEEIQNELWSIAVAIRKANNDSILNQYVAMVQKLMDTHTIRVRKGLDTRLPNAIWWTTGGLLCLSSLLLGLSSGLHNKRSTIASAIVVVCFSAVIIMIVDLDRPFRSLFSRSGDPFAEALLETMKADAP